ncbi:MAG: chlororespiratory reduction protein 7 [Xenococcus sp. MO_188.B8]|nr:chlororespiratory reduction protein 7 [Xenococcus sp. MO_188.B8]
MADSIMYQEDGYVVLEADNPEQFMTPEELQGKLQNILRSGQVTIPREVTKFEAIEDQAKHLMENYFELDVGEDNFLQWYVVRWEK